MLEFRGNDGLCQLRFSHSLSLSMLEYHRGAISIAPCFSHSLSLSMLESLLNSLVHEFSFSHSLSLSMLESNIKSVSNIEVLATL